MNLPAKTLLHKLYYGIEEMPKWNPTVLEARVIKVSPISCYNIRELIH